MFNLLLSGAQEATSSTASSVIIIVVFVIFIAGIMILQKKSVGKMPADLQKKYEGQIKNSIIAGSVAVYILNNDTIVINYNNKWYEFSRSNVASVYTGKANNIGFGLSNAEGKKSDCEVVGSKAAVNMKPGFFTMAKGNDANTIVDFICSNVSGLQRL